MWAYAPEDLPVYDNIVDTNEMGDCVSVIVLWGLVGTRYTNVRGWHGMGGIEAIDFKLLFAKVPNTITTQIIVIASGMGTAPYLLNNVQGRIYSMLSAANIRIVYGASRATVDRSGFVVRI